MSRSLPRLRGLKMETTEQETTGRSDWGRRGCWEMAGVVMCRRATQGAQITLGCAHRKKHEVEVVTSSPKLSRAV